MNARVAALLLLLLGIGCHRPTAPAPTVRRVVSLAPSSTEILYALGAGALLVGVDQFSDWPPAAHALPRVGGELAPSVERILALKPDLVLLATSANTRQLGGELERLGVRVVLSRADRLDDVFADIARIGAAVGRATAAAALVAGLRARLAAVAARVASAARPKTLVVVWTDPLSVAGGHSFVDEAIVAAGGDDVAADSPQPYPQYSVERLLARAPEVIVVGSRDGAPSLAPLEALALPAVRLRRLHRLDADLLFRPGPRLVDGIEALSRILHP